MSHIEEAPTYDRTQDRLCDTDLDTPASAPVFDVPERKIVAVDHPCTLLNLDAGLQSFGPKPNFRKVSRPLLSTTWQVLIRSNLTACGECTGASSTPAMVST